MAASGVLLPVCVDLTCKRPLLPLFTDSHPVFYYAVGSDVYSVHREHVGFFDYVCQCEDARSFEQLMFAYASKYVEGAASLMSGAAAKPKNDADAKPTKKVGVTIADVFKILNVTQTGEDDDYRLLVGAIDHARATGAASQMINDQLMQENPAEFKTQWGDLAWVLLSTAAEKLSRKFAPTDKDHPMLVAMCAAIMGSCEANFLAMDTVASIFKPLIVPVRAINTKKRKGYVGADVYKGLKTLPVMTWAAPSDATSGCCDFETWMTFLGPNRPHVFNKKGRPTLAEESVYTLVQSPHYVASVQNLIEASLVRSSGISYDMLNFKHDKSDMGAMSTILLNGLLQDMYLARQSNNIVWLKDMKHNFFEPSEFSLPDGQVPANPKSGKSWGKACYTQIKGLGGPGGPSHSWQSVELMSGNQPRLQEALQYMTKMAVSATNGMASKVFNTKFCDSVERSVVVTGTITQASFNACSEKAMYLEGKDEFKIADINPDTLKNLKYKLGMRIETAPCSVLNPCMVFKFCCCVEYLHILFAALRGSGDTGVPLQAYDDLTSLRTDGLEFRANELRDMVCGVEKNSYEPACSICPKDETNLTACVGFSGYIPRTTGFRCSVTKPLPANANAASAAKPDVFPWCEKMVASASPAKLNTYSQRIKDIADHKMYTMITSAMADSPKPLMYMRPAMYTMTGVPLNYEAFLNDKYKRAPCFPKINFDYFCSAGQNGKRYVRCVWPDERNNGKPGPVMTLLNPNTIYSQAYMDGNKRDSGVQQVQLSERVSDAIMMLQQNKSFSSEDLDDYGLDADSRQTVIDILTKAGVEYKGNATQEARLSRKRSAADDDDDEDAGEEAAGGSKVRQQQQPPPEKKQRKSAADFLDNFLNGSDY
ncbi:protein ORF88 [Cyprinid herpesvirus 2]|uniref:Protein ORF88 n=1 Tax=Cyprinid herpesvirus 2 TaxID=317878 RepID=K7PCC9_CYHV2|nr:protein ORF88 [Cyprinid herpesvirus 2]AFJ20517.1 protein ORF88 [Cyprinid herpesvirus 2]